MCSSFGGKGWHDRFPKVQEQTNGRVGGSEAYYARELDRLEHISRGVGQRCLVTGERAIDLIHEGYSQLSRAPKGLPRTRSLKRISDWVVEFEMEKKGIPDDVKRRKIVIGHHINSAARRPINLLF